MPTLPALRAHLRQAQAGSPIVFEEKGTYSPKGVPDIWQLYEAVPHG